MPADQSSFAPGRVSLLREYRITVGTLAAFLGAAIGAAAEGVAQVPQAVTGADATHLSTALVARALRIDGSIQLDGRLGEPAWRAAVPVTRFTQLTPDEGQPSSERTEVRIAYDAHALYIGAHLYDSGPVMTRLVRRDAYAEDSDWLLLSFDTYHNHQTASVFAVNPSGVRRDATGVVSASEPLGGGAGFPDDGSEWNPVWDVATARTDSGWAAEIMIPFSQLRFSRADSQTWGLQIRRTIARRAEETLFSFSPRTDRGGAARFGHLEGLEQLTAGRPLEIVPYVSARADLRRVPRHPAVDFDNPFRSNRELSAAIGADLQYRVSSNFTLNAAVNPDFGQVEVDPAVINLTAFETRLQENRPFFIEGAEIFQFGGGFGSPLLYTRRIGRTPSLRLPPDAIYSDLPDAARILGAAKLTGRTAGGWSIGVLEAVTNEERAPYVDATGRRLEATVEPLSNHFAARFRRELNSGRTSIGALATSVNRGLDGETQRSELRSDAYTGGIDFRHEWANRTWSVTGFVSPSHIRGTREVMVATQNSSARYFGRPDADHLSVDSDATSMTGYAAWLNIAKVAGAVTASLDLDATSPAYEINDLGFQTTADRIGFDSRLGYRQLRPGRLLRSWSVLFGTNPHWNYAGDWSSQGAALIFDGQLLNYWSGGVTFRREFPTLNDRLTRGGPLARNPSGSGFSFDVASDFRRPYMVRGDYLWFRDERGATRQEAGVEVEWRPATNWYIGVGPSLSRNRGAPQYVQSVTDATATRTFGTRYVFAEIDQATVSLETRLNVNFTPDLSFELYAQPLIASGDFGTLMELERPRSLDFVRYGADAGSTISGPDNAGLYTVDPDGAGSAASFHVFDRDFSTLSLRGNAVLRWEWRPGSTLFLAWQQSRAETRDILTGDGGPGQVGRFDAFNDARDLFALRPDNVLMLKLTYWLNP